MDFSRYVALGDSFTEGVGDPDPTRPNGVRGWADRLATELALIQPGLEYANLAIRGRKLRPVLAEQLEPALAMKPNLVSIYAGGNDVLRPSVDIDALMLDYGEAIGRLSAAGAHVVMFTAYDPGSSRIFAPTRGRFAIYSEFAREIAERHGATLVDFWRLRTHRDPRMWDVDRLHMSSAGHQQMAIEVLDALGIGHSLEPLDVAPRQQASKAQARRENVEWVRAHAGPWVKRRLTGKSSGDGLAPRWPVPMPPPQ